MPGNPNHNPGEPGKIGTPLDAILERFEAAWAAGKPPEIDGFLREAGPLRLTLLRELVHIDLERRLRNGEPARVESYLKRFPELSAEPSRVASLVLAEFGCRRSRQPNLAPDEFLRRFPAQRAELLAAARAGHGRQLSSLEPIAMIAFACPHCGAKMNVKEQFAGRKAPCPTCKQPLVVPSPQAMQTTAPTGQIDGALSSLAQAGLAGNVTLALSTDGADKPIRELLGQRAGGQRYLLANEIARGGMGAVLRAVDCDIRREVAVKFLLNQADATSKARFVEEAQITGQLEHPNIPPVHEVGVDKQQRLFFAMKMVRGRSLAQVLDQLRKDPRAAEKDWPLGRLLNVVVNICNALAYAHSRGVIHRDLKPANVMMGDFGEVYVMDWGLAKVLKSRDREEAVDPVPLPHGRGSSPNSKVVVSREPDIDMTQQGAVMGTPAYMPHEKEMGKIDALDARSDIYSLGAILYELLAHVPPVDKEGGYLAVLMRVSEGEILAPEQRVSQRANRIPRELSAIAMKALAKEPAKRYPSAEGFRRDIERFLEGRSVSAKDDTAREMAWKFVKRNKAVSLVGAAAAILIGSLLTWSSWVNYQANKKTEKANTNLLAAQRDKDERTRAAVPALVDSARLLANEGKVNEAQRQIELALDYEKTNADAHLLKGQLLVGQKNWAAGRTQLEQYLKLRPDDTDARKLMTLCEKGRKEDTAFLVEVAEIFQKQRLYGVAARMLQDVARSVEARQPLLALYRKQIEKAWPGQGQRLTLQPNGRFRIDFRGYEELATLEPLKGIPLNELDLTDCKRVTDFGALRGMPLTWLALRNTQVRDLGPLRGMPLTWLNLDHCKVRDLGPLEGMPLTWLTLHGCREVQGLGPLKGMPLRYLNLPECELIRDLTALRGMPLTTLHLGYILGPLDLLPLEGITLEELTLPIQVRKGMSVVRSMKTLTRIDGGPANDWWKKYDAGQFPQYKK